MATEKSPPVKTYNEKQTAQILKRALELQLHQSEKPHETRGLTFDDLVLIGKEVGIDPEFLRQASLSATESSAGSGWVGGPLQIQMERFLDRECTEDDLKELQMQMATITKGFGNGLVHKGRFAWDAQPNSYTTQYLPWHLQLDPCEGKTRISLQVDLRVWAWSLHGGIIGGLGLGLGISSGVAISFQMGNGFGALVAIPLVLAGSYALAWGLYRWTVRWAEKEGRKILDKISRHFSQES